MIVVNRNKFYRLHVQNICEWISFLLKLQHKKTARCACGVEYVEYDKWVFRGQSNADWPLRSAFERKLLVCANQNLTERALRLSESAAIDSFKRETRLRFTGIEERSNVDWLGLMQHYGTPTRLLDFTDSAFVSLFFAVDTDPTTDYAVWAVRLNGLTAKIFGELSVHPGLAPKVEKELRQCKQNPSLSRLESAKAFARKNPNRMRLLFSNYSSIDERIRKNYEFANVILGRTSRGVPRRARTPFVLPIRLAHNNDRVTAQSGLFLMPSMLSQSFGENLRHSVENPEEAEEELKDLDGEKINIIIEESLLIKFIFSKSTLGEAKLLLDCSNISAKTLFPGIEGIAKSIDYFKSIEGAKFYRFMCQQKGNSRN